MLHIEKAEKHNSNLSINGLSLPDWREHKWQQFISITEQGGCDYSVKLKIFQFLLYLC